MVPEGVSHVIINNNAFLIEWLWEVTEDLEQSLTRNVLCLPSSSFFIFYGNYCWLTPQHPSVPFSHKVAATWFKWDWAQPQLPEWAPIPESIRVIPPVVTVFGSRVGRDPKLVHLEWKLVFLLDVWGGKLSLSFVWYSEWICDLKLQQPIFVLQHIGCVSGSQIFWPDDHFASLKIIENHKELSFMWVIFINIYSIRH